MALHLDRRAADLAERVAQYPHDVLLTTDELAAWLAVHPISIKRWHHQGVGPRATRMGPRRLRFKKSDVVAWLNQRAGA